MVKKKGKKRIKKFVKPLSEIDDKLKDKIVEDHLKKIGRIGSNAKARALEFEKQTRKQTATAIAAAFSFVIALFWRDAVQDVIDKTLKYFGLTNETYIAKILAALLVTALGVFAITRISKWGELEKK